MITPVFEVKQDDEFIVIIMKVPHIRAKEVDFYIIENEFKFYCKPYFLRLTFPHPLLEDDARRKADYDYDTGLLTVHLPKEVKGQYFENLDMLTQLLEKKGPAKKPLIEILDNKTEGMEGSEANLYDQDDIDWEFDQAVPQAEPSTAELLNQPHYGFNNQFANYFAPLQADIREIIENPMPDGLPADKRSVGRIEFENHKFDKEHYMIDFIEDGMIDEILQFEPKWNQLLAKKREMKKNKNSNNNNNNNTSSSFQFNPPTSSQTTTPSIPSVADLNPANIVFYAQQQALLQQQQQQQPQQNINSEFVFGQNNNNNNNNNNNAPSDNMEWQKQQESMQHKEQIQQELVKFSDSEKEVLRRLPHKEYLMTPQEGATWLISLVDIVYAYAYNHRTNFGENTVESAWNIVFLSPSLSWLETFPTLHSALLGSMRRTLVYPLYRHWKLSEAVLEDVKTIFRVGKRLLVKILIEIKNVFERSESFHHYTRLFIDDYCSWVQTLSQKRIKSLNKELKKIRIQRSEIGWPLDELETEAFQRLEEEEPMYEDNERPQPMDQ